MFKVTSEPKFTHSVKVCVPVDGGHREETFKATFRVIPIDELDDTATLEGQQVLLRRVVSHLDELIGDDEKPLPYSDELRDQLIAVPYVRAAMFQTYLAAITLTRVGN